jgi:hypothetical protein
MTGQLGFGRAIGKKGDRSPRGIRVTIFQNNLKTQIFCSAKSQFTSCHQCSKYVGRALR